MRTKNLFLTGIWSGLIMGISLFVAGAVFSRIIYGPQFAPPGKFEPENLNAWYFIWTKALIGIFFGILFTFAYDKLPLAKRINSMKTGVQYSIIFWFIMTLWNISHPLIYGNFKTQNEVFWILYSLGGFTGFGASLGYFYGKWGIAQVHEN